MIRKQKVYEVGTLLSRRTFIGEGQVASFPTENGIIVEKYHSVVDIKEPDQLYYRIQWDGGGKFAMSAKSLKGYVKSGYIEILSEG
jgi:hypothetical protein